jgi:beta-lactamase class C
VPNNAKQTKELDFLKRYRHRLSLFILSMMGIVAILILFSKGMRLYDPGTRLPDVQHNVHGARGSLSREVTAYPPVREFIEFMNRELDSSSTVGAAYTVVRGGRVEYTTTFGEIRKGSGIAVDDHTIFRLASVSKGFAGALACMLEQEGVFSLDSVNTADMTIRNLLSHTTGLVPFAFDNLVEEGVDLGQIVSRLREVDISAPPGALYGYQNVTFSMLDPITRRATGTPYQVLLEEMIFKPLGMNNASAGQVPLRPGLNMASPHVRGGEGFIPLDPQSGCYYNVLPAAGVNASISDMGQWLLALLGHQPGSFPDTVRNLLAEPLIYTPLKYRYTRYWQPFRERYYSLGWRIYFYRDRKIVYHGGYIRGCRAEIAYCPQEDVGIAFLQNSPTNLASKCIPRFFDLYFDHLDGSGKTGPLVVTP